MLQLNSVSLRGQKQVRLDRVSVSFTGRWTAVVGNSGAGKTSLLNVLAGFESPDAGTMTRSATPGRLPLYWVPQTGGLWGHLTADEHIRLLADTQTADKLLTLFALSHRRQARPGELSQGERSRLSVARAVASRAAWLLLDEPLSHVDPGRKPEFWSVLKTLAEEADCSVIFSSHEPDSVLRYAQNIVCLSEGSVVFDGTVSDLYDAPPTREAGESLGPVNWFSGDEAACLLGQPTRSASIAIRPEWLTLTADGGSSLTVEECDNRGLCRTTLLRHQPSGRTIAVLHRLTDERLRPGDAVALRIQK